MNLETIGMMDFKLHGCGAQFKVSSMVLYAEAGHLPMLNVLVIPDEGFQPTPQIDAGPYTLRLEKNGQLSEPFGVSNWFVQTLSCFTQAKHQTSYFMRLGVLPGQHLSMQGYAVDGLNVSAVLQQVCDRLLGQRTMQNRFLADDPVVGTVLSFNETMGQFLGRMARTTDSWLLAEDGGADTLNLHWQPTLQGLAPPPSFNAEDWAETCVAQEQSAAPCAVRTLWPRSSLTQVAQQQPSAELYTQELLNLLPLPAQAPEKTTANTSPWQTSYHLSNKLAHATAWPGLRLDTDQVIIGTIHVYDQNSASDVLRLLGQLVPGLRDKLPLASDAAYGMLAIATPSGQRYVSAASALARLGLADSAARLGGVLGMPGQPAATHSLPPTPHMVLATVCPWDEETSKTWAAGSENGSNKHNTEIKVCFDWSDKPVRVPYGYPMSGNQGVAFYPPAAGDRVLVLLEGMWPILACAAYQASDIRLPSVLRRGADIDTLSAQRGMVVNGGLIFRTADNGDLVIHAAGNLVLRAEKDIYIDGQHVREHGREKNGSDDAARST
jgi:hypothetical protein